MRVIDLSHPITTGMPVWPGDPGVGLARVAGITPEGFRLTRISLGSHTGTHLDSPAHVLLDGKALHELPLERCVGPGCVVDLRGHAIITEAVLAGAAAGSGDCDFLLVHTGWGTRWGTPEYYARWPSLAPDATIWLTRQGFKGIGLDTPSPDQDGDAALAAHHQLLGAGLVVVENLAHLDVLPQRGFTFMSLPLPLHGGDASPVRAVALVE